MNRFTVLWMKRLVVVIGLIGLFAFSVMHYQKLFGTVRSNSVYENQPTFFLEKKDLTRTEEEIPTKNVKNSLDIGKKNMKNLFLDKTIEYIKKKDLSDSFRLAGCLPYRNIMSEKHPHFLSNFKNPCWREESFQNPDTTPGVPVHPATVKNITAHTNQGNLWQPRCLPYFYLAGFLKCGSREVFYNIRNHPMVPNSNAKENHWWPFYRVNCNRHTSDRAVPIREYANVYHLPAMDIEGYAVESKKWKDGYHPMIIGDGSSTIASQNVNWWNLPENRGRELYKDVPRYTNADYIKSLTPNAKIIISMRNPADRLYSCYKMVCRKRATPEQFHDDVVNELKLVKKFIEKKSLEVYASIPRFKALTASDHCLIFSDSLYYPHLVRWLKTFPRKQFHFNKLEEFSKDRVTHLNNIFEFLGLEPLAQKVLKEEPVGIEVGNCSTCRVPPMLDETRQILEDFFHPYNEMTADLLHDSRWAFK